MILEISTSILTNCQNRQESLMTIDLRVWTISCLFALSMLSADGLIPPSFLWAHWGPNLLYVRSRHLNGYLHVRDPTIQISGISPANRKETLIIVFHEMNVVSQEINESFRFKNQLSCHPRWLCNRNQIVWRGYRHRRHLCTCYVKLVSNFQVSFNKIVKRHHDYYPTNGRQDDHMKAMSQIYHQSIVLTPGWHWPDVASIDAFWNFMICLKGWWFISPWIPVECWILWIVSLKFHEGS